MRKGVYVEKSSYFKGLSCFSVHKMYARRNLFLPPSALFRGTILKQFAMIAFARLSSSGFSADIRIRIIAAPSHTSPLVKNAIATLIPAAKPSIIQAVP